MPFDCPIYSDRKAYYAIWTGETFDDTAVFQVSSAYIKSVKLDQPVPRTLNYTLASWVYGIGIFFDQKTGRIFYSSNRLFNCCRKYALPSDNVAGMLLNLLLLLNFDAPELLNYYFVS